MMMLQFCDIEVSVQEASRAAELGYEGIVFGGHMERGGFERGGCLPLWGNCKIALESMVGLDEAVARKVFYENAAAVYGFPVLPVESQESE